MKRVFYLLTICISITIYSCAKDVLPKPKEITHIDNTLTLDRQAKTVKNLKSLLASIDSTLIKTRGYIEKREIKNVEVIRNISIGTRASVEVDSLLFIINFKDEKGYALVGANDYFDGILAIVDSGNISAKEFLCTRLINLDSDIHILHNQILNYTIQTINKNSSFHSIQGYYSTDGWTMSIMVPAMLKTRWHQYAPYNMYCPEKNGQHCLTGCVSIAVAQILAYNKLTYGVGNNKLATYNLNWSGIFDEIENPGTNVAAVATLIRAVGKSVLTDYGLDGSSSNIYNAAYAFTSMGYGFLQINNYATKHAYKTIVDRGMPTYIRGVGYDTDGNKTGGHAWVLDGYYEYKRFIYDKPYNPFDPFILQDPPKVIGTEVHHLVHCNFGWVNGAANGYYLSGIFNLEDGAKELDPGSSPSNITTWKDIKILDYQR